ncbi:hypothetical protein [Nocardioides aurantiacus]|uniref:hypothetical protein n=1 Tax=Nocardioides aurantiacus TaxID=86796 RepID=UPI00403F8524
MNNYAVDIVDGDVPDYFERAVRKDGLVAWDIETSGLDWRLDRIGTCQLHAVSAGTLIVQINGHVPDRLRDLLGSSQVTKVFHHAPFDLRFMSFQWKVVARKVACTKILSKVVRPDVDKAEHSLKPALARYLGVDIDKGEQQSDWLRTDLTEAQKAYAARDVQFLIPLLHALYEEARGSGVADIVDKTFEYIPVRVETDIRDCGDVFAY